MFPLHPCLFGVQITKQDKLNCKAAAEERNKEGQINEFQWKDNTASKHNLLLLLPPILKRKKKNQPL